MTMPRGQFIALTAVLAAVVMAGAGYLTYSAVSHSPTSAQARPPATGSGPTPGQDGSPVTVPTGSLNGIAAGDPSATATPPTGKAPECGNGDVTVSLGQSQGAAGHISVLLLFTNDVSHPCTLHNYPGAELTDPSGSLPALDASRTLVGFMGGAKGLSRPPVVPLNPGQTVAAVLEWTDVTSGSTAACYTGKVSLGVTPPDTTQTTKLNLGPSAMVCGGFQVHPVLPVVGNTPTG